MSEITGYELPSNWIWTTIGDLVSDVRPGFASGKKNVIGGLAHLRMNNITSSCTLDITDLKRVPQELATPRHMLLPGDILFCHTNSQKLVGKTAFFNLKEGKYAFSNHLTRLRVNNDGPTPEWIWYGLAMLWRNRYFETRCKQWVNQATVVKENILSAPIPLPPFEEQRRILNRTNELFSESKVAKQSIDEIQPILKKFRESILEAAFRGKLTERDPNDEPAEKLLEGIRNEKKKKWQADLRAKGKDSSKKFIYERVFDSDKPYELPEGWVWTYLDNISLKITDGEHLKPKVTTIGIPFLSAKDVRDEGIIFDNKFYISERDAKKFRNRCNPENGDILIVSRGATVGRSCIINTEKVFCILGTVILIKLSQILNSKFLSYAIKSPGVQNQLKVLSGSTAQQAIYLRDIIGLLIPLPSLDEQKRILNRIDELFSLVDQIEKSLEQARQRINKIDISILTKAFHGKIVTQDPNEEPASVLLERIKAGRNRKSGLTESNELSDSLKQMTLN